MTDKKEQEFYSNYKYNDRYPHFIEKSKLTEEQEHKLVKSDVFCILPWVHMHAYPDGRAYTCCVANYDSSMGNLRKHTMSEIWNQEKFRTIRIKMLNDEPATQCQNCYEQERNGLFSLRNDSNRNYGHHIADIDKTLPDGTHPDFKMLYWDVRFSNLCNFSCRSCGPVFSSNWYNDHVKLYGSKPKIRNRVMDRVEYTAGNDESMLEQMLPHIPYLEQVYFAGGEPLIMKEHYFMLEKLIEHGKTDIRIQYNTNFSELAFKDKHVFEYWKHFKNVSVGASLDASGHRAEIMRKGTVWTQTLENRQRMKEEVPHVDFYIAATVSVMNVLHILDFHREWTELGYIRAEDININVLQGPEWYRIDILPEEFKNQVVIPAYQQHLEWLRPLDKMKRATIGFEGILNYLQSKNQSHLLPQFVSKVNELDNIRNEDFWTAFPELSVLKC